MARRTSVNNIFTRRPTAANPNVCARRAWVGGFEDELNKNLNNNDATQFPKDDSVDSNMALLKYRIARNKAIGPGIQPNQTPPKDVHIILFYPESEDEGVHTIEFPKGSGNNVILGFEDLKECMEFSRLLEQEETNLFVEPEPRQIHLKSLEAYCATTLGGDVQVQVVPRGTHLVPPSGTVEELSHTPKQYEEHHKQTTELERIFDLDLVDDKYDDSFDSVGAWE